ncbi:MAG: GTP-binding protein [Clostridia bacterium]|nr:GTP-binding protein [Clostridia bacterium]
MTRIDIFSGFLGAGKTTLIKKLLREAYDGEKVVLIENEFGEIGIDGGFLKEAGIEITEMNSGCICCSLVGDFSEALQKVLAEYAPDRILIEPSGVGKLSDVMRAVQSAVGEGAMAVGLTTVVDANKCKMYMKNFGEFFNDQIEHAKTVILSHTDRAPETKINEAVELLRKHNPEAVIVTTPLDKLTGAQLLAAIEQKNTLHAELEQMERDHHDHKHHHHDHDEDCDCGCHDHEHEHHHHDHDEDCDCACHDHEHEHHHHDHGEDCDCGCHGHHHHHHADEVFASWGCETARSFTEDEIRTILDRFDEDDSFGMILRAKGILPSADGEWIHFDYIPGESNVRRGAADITGRLCVIGSKIDKEALSVLFMVK